MVVVVVVVMVMMVRGGVACGVPHVNEHSAPSASHSQIAVQQQYRRRQTTHHMSSSIAQEQVSATGHRDGKASPPPALGRIRTWA